MGPNRARFRRHGPKGGTDAPEGEERENTMKNKTKIMLGLSLLTAGTLAAGATGTFAWFTTNKSAKATYSKITAQADTQKIKVVIGGITDSGVAEGSNYNDTNDSWLEAATSGVSASSFTGDISSADGLTFKKPIWESNAANTAKVLGVRDAYNGVNVVGKAAEYTQFYFGLTNTGTTSVKVFLNQNTLIEAASTTSDADKALANWTRAAIIEAGTEKPEQVVTEGTLKVVFENDVTGSTKGKYVKGVKENDATALDIVDITSNYHKGKFSTVTKDASTTSDAYLVTLASNETKYYAVSVWMEGTESDNQDAAADGSVNVTLGFSGIE